MRYSLVVIASSLFLLTACSNESDLTEYPVETESNKVIFNAESKLLTRSAGSNALAEGTTIYCRMAYHTAVDATDNSAYDTEAIQHATLKTGANGLVSYDGSTAFYWQNRLSHVFRAVAGVTADEAKLDSITIDLRRGTLDSMDEQPDPLAAYVRQIPAGSTAEANRVTLPFVHQLARIQINIKAGADGSVVIDPSQIDSVVLIGSSKQARVYPYISANGSAKATRGIGTQNFLMFKMSTPAAGYIASYNAVAFGKPTGIQIIWHEGDIDKDKPLHTPVMQIGDALQSGHQYVYNIELRRGSLSALETQVFPWEDFDKEYNASGTIVR